MGNLDFIKPTGKFEDWNVYKLSLIVVDITDMFVKTYLDMYRDRTVDQMVQAARSCKQNIVEGSVAAATSRETEIKLTNVAKASLTELREDYLDYLRHHNLAVWGKDDPRTSQIRRFSKKHDNPAEYIEKLSARSAEAFCNIAVTLCHQLDYMLYCVIERAKANFLQNGGIKEEMYRARKAVQASQYHQSYQSYQRTPASPGNQSYQSYQRTPANPGNQSYQSYQRTPSRPADSSHNSDNSYRSRPSESSDNSDRSRPSDSSHNSDNSDKSRPSESSDRIRPSDVSYNSDNSDTKQPC